MASQSTEFVLLSMMAATYALPKTSFKLLAPKTERRLTVTEFEDWVGKTLS